MEQPGVLFDELLTPDRSGQFSEAQKQKIKCNAVKSLGNKECEIHITDTEVSHLHEEVCDLHKDAVPCDKNRNHPKFFPVNEFGLDRLPKKFQNNDIHDCITFLSVLTVFIGVSKTSNKRPENSTFHQLAEKNMPEHIKSATGSVFIPPNLNSSHASNDKYHVYVSTAHHVIYDDYEARNTKVGMYFDDKKNTESIVWLQGTRLVRTDAGIDRCILECETDDKDIITSIEQASNSLREIELKLKERYAEDFAKNGGPLMALMLSHPHGCSKQITFGTQVSRMHVRKHDQKVDKEGVKDIGQHVGTTVGHDTADEMDLVQIVDKEGVIDNDQQMEWTKYLYDTPTCRGCSGALVFLLGQGRIGHKDESITIHTHTGVHTDTLDYKGYNESGGGLDYVVASPVRRSCTFYLSFFTIFLAWLLLLCFVKISQI